MPASAWGHFDTLALIKIFCKCRNGKSKTAKTNERAHSIKQGCVPFQHNLLMP